MVPSLPGPGVPSNEWPALLLPKVSVPSDARVEKLRLPGLAALVVDDREADLLRIVVATTTHAERFGALGRGLSIQ